MTRAVRVSTVGVCFIAAMALVPAAAHADLPAFERTEKRTSCKHYDPLRKPLFGDLHVHTRYSFDAYISKQRNDPWGAYRYAKGEPIMLPDENGEPVIEAKIQRPLDFAAVTDYAEFLGQTNICTEDPLKLGYWWPHCIMTRADSPWLEWLAAHWWVSLVDTNSEQEKEKSFACSLSDCGAGEAEFWSNIQQAAEDHYDRSADCKFTTFVGYEYTDAPQHKSLHRSVIFRNADVIESPISSYDTGAQNSPELWYRLRAQCIEGDGSCDVLSIPHNSNLSSGLMFEDPKNEREELERLFFEPVIEITQHKAVSECRFDRLAKRGLDTEDEFCDFEQAGADDLSTFGTVMGEMSFERAAPVPLDRFARRAMARNALKDGLALAHSTGVNSFKFGFIGSTDTHNATPGGTEEDNHLGHVGRRDSGFRKVQDYFFNNPGGHAVVWAEENSRDAIFAGIRRRETYATSGTRPAVRFFAGWGFSDDLCESPDLAATGYAQGVPMGGEMLPRPAGTRGPPTFLVAAMKDEGSVGHPGTDLQRIQIIKGWTDVDGRTHEAVYEVAGDPDNEAWIDEATCEPTGTGFSDLCRVWRDVLFDPSQHAFYYVRVLENPTCRWSTLQCQSVGVNPFSADCAAQSSRASAKVQERGGEGEVYRYCCTDPATEPFYTPVIQERAWTSPIWFTPAPNGADAAVSRRRSVGDDPA